MPRFIEIIPLTVLLMLLFYFRIVFTTSDSTTEIVPTILDDSSISTTAICQSGYFRCNSTNQCYEQRKNCDGIADCDDSSDEWNCVDNFDSLYWDHLFKKNPAALSDDIIDKSCVWPNLNNTCDCRLDELLCQHKSLTHLPSYLPTDGISLLDLTGNFYPILTKKFFNTLTEVDTLVLNHCSIELIQPYAFYKLNEIYLHVLHLEQNKINLLPEYFFPPNNSVEKLYLGGNQLVDLHNTSFLNLNNLIILDLRNNHIISFTSDTFLPLKKLKTLYLMKNNIMRITENMLPSLNSLSILSLAENNIKYISKNSLRFLNLENLFLSDNQLPKIYNHTFKYLPNLLALNLDNNKIREFEINSFQGVENLTSLFLAGNNFEIMNSSVLQNLTKLEFIYFSSFKFCKAALHVRNCDPRGDGISSTKHLLDNIILRGSVWIMAAIAIIGNIVVLLGRLIGSTKRTQSHIEHSLYLRHLAASDLLMGIYLAIIATADINFRGQYIIHDENWRHSSLCSLCGFLSTLSCQSSTYLLTLVTWDRLISVTRPLQPKPSSKLRAILRLGLLWGTAGAAAASPLSSKIYFGEHFYGNNGVCLSLHIHEPYAQGWQYSAIMFILINAASLLFIVISYLRMLQAIRGSGEAMRSTLSGRESVVATRFAIIVATDCSCWLPVIIVKLCALAGAQISPALYAWLAVLVLPVNSALNPILYTLTTASFKQQVTKFIYSLPCGAAILSRQQNGYESALSISLPITGSTRKHIFQRNVSGNNI